MPLHEKFDHALSIAPALPLEAKATAGGVIEGYASTFDGTADRQGDIVRPGAFTRTLGEHKAQGSMPSMLWSHRLEQPIGRWTAAAEDDHGLHVKGQLNLKTTAGREALEHILAGDAGGLSIGYITPDGGREYLGNGTWEITDVDLAEVSVVAVPANPLAQISAVKQLGSKREAIEFLRAAGLSRAAAAKLAAGGFPALSAQDEPLPIEPKAAADILRALDAATNLIRSKA